MEALREVATAYYERSNDHEKEPAKEFFRKLDVNGDGKVSLTELKKSIGATWLANEKIFKELDKNGNETLDFYEVLAVYYMLNKVQLYVCNGCQGLLVGPYFSCLLCLGKNPDTFDLCCFCYRRGNVSHEHSDKYLLDHHSLLSELRKRNIGVEKGQWKREIEELGEIAKAHYEACSPEVRVLADDFFRTMDTDGDGKVDLSEFLAFMGHQGYSQMHNPSFFNVLDHDGNGTLDFHEVMTLYYIIKSGRPFCNSCGSFIPGTFFSCVECHKNPERSFNLCRDCYRSTKCKHYHDGHVQFLDNYTLLEAKRDSPLAQIRPTTSNENKPMKEINPYMSMSATYPTNTAYPPPAYPPPAYMTYTNTTYPPTAYPPPAYMTYMNTAYPPRAYPPAACPPATYTTYMNATYPFAACPPSPMPNYSNAIIPATSSMDKWKIALQALETALAFSSTLCTIL